MMKIVTLGWASGIRFGCWLVVVCASLALTSWSADDPYQTFVTTDSTHFRAVMLRVLDRHYVIATRKGVQEVRRGSILVPGQMTDETHQIDQVLALIERYIRSGDHSRVANQLPELHQLVDRFKGRVKSDLNSSAKPLAHKDTLRHAISFYEQQLATIAPTMSVLELSADIHDAYSKYRQDLLLFNTATLSRLIGYQRRYNELDIETPLVAKERQEAAQKLDELLENTSRRLREEVQATVRQSRNPESAVALLRALKEGAGQNAVIGKEAQVLIETVTGVSASVRGDLLAALAECLGLADQRCVIEDKDYLVHRSNLMERMRPGLVALQDLTFGTVKPTLDALLADELLATDADLESTRIRRQAMSVIQERYEEAEGHYKSRAYSRAAEVYESILPLLETARPASDALEGRIENQALRSRTESLLGQVRTPSIDSTPQQLAALEQKAETFVEQHADRLLELGYKQEEIQAEIQALDLYRVYGERFAKIDEEKMDDPMRTWQRVLFMTRWLETHKSTIQPQALKHWQAFLAENEDAIFNRARDVFFDGDTGLSDQEHQETFTSFVEKFVKNGEYDRALSAIDKALATQSADDEFASTLLTLQMSISAQLAEAGDLVRAAGLYKDIIENYPNFATRHNVASLLAGVQKSVAEKLVAEGKVQAAAELYETICINNRSYAQRHDLMKRLLNLKTEQLGYEPGGELTPEVLAIFEHYSKMFPGYLANLQDLRALKKELTADFKTLWQEGKADQAVERFVELNSSYPQLSQEMQLPRQILVVARNHLARLKTQLEDSEGPPVVARNNTLIAAGKLLKLPETADLSQRPLTENLYIGLLLRRAEEHFEVGQIAKGYAIYDQILQQYPEVADEQDVKDIMAEKQWDLRMEKVRRPLGIKSGLDWFFLGLWIVIWSGFFIYARRQASSPSELKYRLQHFANVFGVFMIFLIVFLVFNMSHTSAFLVAFFLPGLLFNALGCATFLFFPLVYWERRLLVEKGIRWLAEESPLSQLTGGEAPEKLAHDIERLENMVSLMNDRRRFEIHMAIRTSERDPAKGDQWLKRIDAKLQEDDQRDKTWRDHHALVVQRLGLLAHEQGEMDQARRYLEQFIEYEPKDLEARQHLADITYDAGDYELAIPHLKVLLAARSQDDSLWYRLGRAFFETGKHVAAYKCFDTAKNKDRDILFYGARSFVRANERERAIKWYQALLKKFGQDTEAVYFFASTLAELGDSAKALKIASVIKPEDAYYPSALALQGNVLFKKNELEKAGKIFHKSLELSPDFVPALLGFGQVMIAAGKLESSRKYFQRILAQEADHPAGNYFLGVLQQEKGDHASAIAHFKKAVDSPGFRRWASRRTGYLSYFANDLDTAVEYLSIAEDAGESSPWILFLLAFSLARQKDLRRCEQVLIKILGRSTSPGQDWSPEIATRAMYAIGTALFQEHAYKMAHQCFEFVRENPIINTDMSTVDDFIEEARFRMVVSWLQRGEYIEAQARCSELQLEAQEDKRFRSCQYYLSLCQLYQGQYLGASNLLQSLVEQEPQNPRYLYHQIVAELGAGNDDKARAAMNSFAGMSNRPAHLAAGLVTVQAYMNARRGKVQDAERSLARVSLPDGDSPGDRYLREKIVLARIFYLCHLNDYETISTLMEDLSEDKRSQALYLQAVSCLQAGDFARAQVFLKPFADRSERDRKLFTYISAQLAIDDLRNHLERDAKQHLDQIPKPPREVKNLLVTWDVSDRLSGADSLDELNELIGLLKGRIGQMEDEYFNYFILHNLSVLYLKRAYITEDSEAEASAKLTAWQEAVTFWYERVIPSGEYWNMAQSQFQEEGKAIRPFPANELEAISQAAKDQYFINVFVGFVLYYLSAGDEASMDRHLQLLREVAERDDKLKLYYRRLGEKVERYLRSIPKSNPLWNSWEFSVASLDLQVRIADILGLDNSNAADQLELYRETRKLYATPVEYQQAKRQFNTLLLETIQIGVRGSFTEAGNMLDKCLSTIPPGVDLGKVQDSLKLLREACRNPAAYAERGVNLSQQFEKAYATVRTINITKGKGDGNAKRS